MKSLKINILLNAVKQSLSLIFPLITFPYVSRVLGSVEYGKYTFSSSIVSYFSLLAAFGISNYAVRECSRIRDDKTKINCLASDLFTINVITSIIAYGLLFSLVFFSPKIRDYQFLIAIQSLCIVLSTIGMDWINTIYEDFLYITIRYILIQLLALISVFIFVKGPEDTLFYGLILVSASYGGNLINLIYVRKYVHIKVNKKLDFKPYLFPLLILFINSFATVIYVNSDITMLGIYSNNHEVGVYSFVSKFYNIIKYFINAVMITVIPRLAYFKERDDEKYRHYIKTIFNILLATLLPIALGVNMLSDSLILIAGGKEYLLGELPLKVLSFSLIFAIISSVFTNCILIINRLEKCCLVATVSSASINIVLNFILIPKIGIVGAAITTVLAEMVNMLIQFFYVKKELNITFNIKFKNLIGVILGTLAVGCACKFANVFWDSEGIVNACKRVSIAFAISCVSYIIILVVTHNDLINKKFNNQIKKNKC